MSLPTRTARALLAALLFFLASAASAADAPKKKGTPPAEEPPIYDVDALGEPSIAFYQKAALDSGRRMLLNLGTNDCEPCRVVNRAIHKDKFFDAFIHQFVPAFVDVSKLPNAALLERYHINPKAELPAIIIFMPDGRLIEALAHGEMAAVAKKGDDAVQAWFLSRFAKD